MVEKWDYSTSDTAQTRRTGQTFDALQAGYRHPAPWRVAGPQLTVGGRIVSPMTQVRETKQKRIDAEDQGPRHKGSVIPAASAGRCPAGRSSGPPRLSESFNPIQGRTRQWNLSSHEFIRMTVAWCNSKSIER